MNLCLLCPGYMLAIVPLVLRVEYIQLPEKVDIDAEPVNVFIAGRVLETQKDILKLLQQRPKSRPKVPMQRARRISTGL